MNRLMPIQLVSTHFDQSPHRIWTETFATSDPWAFVIPPCSPVREADGRVWSSDFPVVALFWPGVYAQVMLLLKATGAEYYCNLITPPVYDAATPSVQFADLDLDVLVTPQNVRVADEDEFELRRPRYPTAIAEAAVAAKDDLVRQAGARRGPFSPATERRWRVMWSVFVPTR